MTSVPCRGSIIGPGHGIVIAYDINGAYTITISQTHIVAGASLIPVSGDIVGPGAFIAINFAADGTTYTIDQDTTKTGRSVRVYAYSPLNPTNVVVNTSGPTLVFAAGGSAVIPLPAILARKWDFEGDSLTVGSGGTAPYLYPNMTEAYAGSANVLLSSVNNGVGGTNLNAMRISMLANLASFDGVILLGGTNDADGGAAFGPSSDPTTSTGAIVAMANACKTAGKPLVVGIPPPFYASFNTNPFQTALIAIRNWILANSSTYKYIVADYFAQMVAGDGQMLAAYQSGDGVHVNSEGYSLMAKILRTALGAAGYLRVNAVAQQPGTNLCSNPGNAGAGAVPTGATEVYADAGAAAWPKTYVADVGGILVPGNRWYKVVADNSAGGAAVRRDVQFAGASLPVGHIGSFRCKYRFTDNNGTSFAQFRTAGAGFVELAVGLGGIVQGGQFFSDGSSPYEVDLRFTSAGTAVHNPMMVMKMDVGENVTVEIGDIGMFDMTASPF